MRSGLKQFCEICRTYWRSETGSSSLEFILSLPFIAGLLAISSEFGRLVLYQHVITQNLRGGVQYLSNIPLDVLRVNEEGSPTCSSTPLSKARSIILSGDPTISTSRYPWWSDPNSIQCSVRLINSAAVQTGSEFWVVELNTSVSVDLPLLALTNSTEVAVPTSLTINASEKARLLEGL